MERAKSPSVEEVIRNAMEHDVPISHVMERTGLSEYAADQAMRSLHRQGVITYQAELQKKGEKVASYNFLDEESADD